MCAALFTPLAVCPLASTTTTAGAVAVPYLVKHVYVRCLLLLCYAQCVPVDEERERFYRAPAPHFLFFSLSLMHVLYMRLFFFFFSVDSCLDSVINSTTGAPCRAVENTLGAGSPVVLVRVSLVAAQVG